MSRRRPAKQISEGVWDKKPCAAAVYMWMKKAKAKYGADSPQYKKARRRHRLHKPHLPTYPHDPCIVQPRQGVTYKPVPNFPKYRIGSDGTPWSNAPVGGRPASGFRQLRVRKDGCITLYGNNGQHGVRVARLVLSLFGTGYQDGMHAHNLDENPKNNDISNLKWVWPAAISCRNLRFVVRTGRPRKSVINKNGGSTSGTKAEMRQVG